MQAPFSTSLELLSMSGVGLLKALSGLGNICLEALMMLSGICGME